MGHGGYIGKVQLHPNEVVLINERPSPWATFLGISFTLGLYRFAAKRHRFILTNQRVILLKGVMSKTEKSIPLERVQDVEVKTSLWLAKVSVTSAGGSVGTLISPTISTSSARRFRDSVLTQSKGMSQGLGSRVTPDDPAEQIRKMAEMRDSGVVSDQEFAAFKAKVLGSHSQL